MQIHPLDKQSLERDDRDTRFQIRIIEQVCRLGRMLSWKELTALMREVNRKYGRS